MLMSGSMRGSRKRQSKYDPNFKGHRDNNQIMRLSKANNKYMNLDRRNIDRNKIYSMRSNNPIMLPKKIFDVPGHLAARYGELDDNEIIFESELMKYKPGIKHQYMSRWCQVTKTNFLYFAEGVPYASYLSRPLAVIPLDSIQSVKRVKVEVPEKSSKYKELTNYQFEIFLKPDEDGEDVNYASNFDTKHEGDTSYTNPLKAKEIKRSATKKDEMDKKAKEEEKRMSDAEPGMFDPWASPERRAQSSQVEDNIRSKHEKDPQY